MAGQKVPDLAYLARTSKSLFWSCAAPEPFDEGAPPLDSTTTAPVGTAPGENSLLMSSFVSPFSLTTLRKGGFVRGRCRAIGLRLHA